MVLRLWGQLAEHLVDTGQLRDTHVELERLIHTLPAGPYQRDRGPSQWLLRLLATQTERAELVPLLDALTDRMHAEKVMDFGAQMASAARLAATFPQVGEDLRNRYRVVLLDEYQDTGHAQRVALSALFGGGCDDGLALTAVGDPIQSIYGWRGASATNLPRFSTDFPLSDGTPAPVLELRTSWRNPPRALHVANAISAEARRRSVAVRALRARPGRPARHRPLRVASRRAGRTRVDRRPPARALPASPGRRRQPADRRGTGAPQRRRRAHRGCLARPRNPGRGGRPGRLAVHPRGRRRGGHAAAGRRPHGRRGRDAGVDRSTLAARGSGYRRAVAPRGRRSVRPIRQARQATPESIAMAAVPTPTPRVWPTRSPIPARPARIRLRDISASVRWPANCEPLRGHLGHSLPDLVAEVRRVLGVDCEVRAAAAASAGWSGAEHLDAFADVVAGYAERATAATSSPAPSVAGLLSYLDAAEVVENGLPPAQSAVARDRVQVLTVHAAKGLEWQVVAVAHLSGGVFPSTASRSSWLTDAAELPPLLRGDRASAGSLGIPVLDTSDVTDRKQLSDKISAHRRQLDQRRVDEERRLLYVGITRTEDTLLVSGHHWGCTGAKPRGPSDFLCELKDVIDLSAAAGDPCGVVEHWAPAPADGERNPLRDNIIEAIWPADPLAGRRADIERGAALVTQAESTQPDMTDTQGWSADVDALLAERACARAAAVGAYRGLPSQLSVSSLVDLARDPAAAVRRLMHRLPTRPDPHALLGNAFHAWVQRFYGAERLFDLGDLPGAADSDVGDTEELAALQTAFGASRWAARIPVAVEVPFEMPIADTVVRGRIDAVFADPDGGATVVDWKTGEPPRGPEALRQAAVQLAVYRLAWAALSGCPRSSVRAAFHYVRTGVTIVPDDLPDPAELTALLAVSNGGHR